MIPATLDPSQYTIVPATAIVDEFVMVSDDGAVSAKIDAAWLQKLRDHMNDRERQTGDLSPIVIGHTPDEPFPETEGPPLIGYLRNWSVGPLFDTGRQAAHADCWIMNEEVERAKKFPRRSAEIYVDRYEIDPCSFLGPTTPARDLGLLKLSRRDGKLCLSYTIPYPNPEMTVPEPKADEKETGAAKGDRALLEQILATLQSLAETLGKGAVAPTEPAPAEGNEPSDEELLNMLNEQEPATQTDERKDEKPVKESRTEQLLKETLIKLARVEVIDALRQLKTEGYAADPDNAELVGDLIAMPEDMRGRAINRLKLSGKSGAVRSANGTVSNLDLAVANGTDGVKRITTVEEKAAVMKLARQKNLRFEDAATEMGYKVGA